MPFETVKTVSGSEKKFRASLSYKRVKGGSGTTPPRLTVGIPAAFAEEVRIKDGQRFVFQLGTGDDAGTARIAPAPNGDGVMPRPCRGGADLPLRCRARARRRRGSETVLQGRGDRRRLSDRSARVA